MAQDPLRYFRIEARDLVDQLGQRVLDLEKGSESGAIVAQVLRLAHTLKGAARVVRQPAIADRAHAIEDVLGSCRDSEQISQDLIDAVLTHVDAIAADVSALCAPIAPAPPAVVKQDGPAVLQALPAEPAPHARLEAEAIDVVLDGLSEVSGQLTALGEAAAVLERMGHISDLLVRQLSPRPGRNPLPAAAFEPTERAHAFAEELRSTLRRFEERLSTTCDHLRREFTSVRENVQQLRLTRVRTLFTPLERTARDAARELGKSVNFTAEGGDVRLDGTVLRSVQDALIQIVRNAVAHGIESPAERTRADKPPTGQIVLSVSRRGRRVVFRCSDDGRGIDAAAVRKAAVARGVDASDASGSQPGAILRLLMAGQVSTSASVSEIAGRGIGMDIVRDSVARLGGDVDVHTEAGRGTTFELLVPLSLAALDALIVEAGGDRVLLPLDAVRHIRRLTPSEISQSASGESILFEGLPIPLVPLARLLGSTVTQVGRALSAVVLAGGSGQAALAVDRLHGTSEIVLQVLPDLAPAEDIVAGICLDVEGGTQIVLDPDALVAAGRISGEMEVAAPAPRPVLVIDDSLTTRMLEQSILESAGYEVDVAVSAEEALKRARERAYALFLVDVEMPGMDGFSFIEHIRRDPDLMHVPAILVTSLSSQEHVRRGEAAGAQGFMIKSEFDQAQLLARVAELTGRA